MGEYWVTFCKVMVVCERFFGSAMERYKRSCFNVILTLVLSKLGSAQKIASSANSAYDEPPPPPPVLQAPKVDLRNYFPETWLFELVDLDEEGNTVLDVSVPDTITTWVADAFCLR